ncbi:MAG TPA: hypothetical protein ENK06_09925 [Gammaproteobacteria bacterium]|nr:hypothetical protein [Gammaproteobacteria bacterium]
MKKSTIRLAISLAIATAATACSGLKVTNEKGQQNIASVSGLTDPNCSAGTNMAVNQYYIDDAGKQARSIKIRVTGYGARPKSFYPDPQRRLMAMRAAKIDAYRSLAERISGIQIWGGSTIGDMVVEKDRFRVYLDTHLAGARVIAENAQEDGTFETIVELKVGQSFLNKTLPTKVSNTCNTRSTDEFKSASASPIKRPLDENFVLSNFNFNQE